MGNEMNDGSVLICVIPLFIVIAIASMMWRAQRSGDLLDNWAASNHFTILSRERKSVLTGPYFFRKAEGQDIYYITVEDADGNQRSGYARVGGMFLGMMSDHVDVTWDA